MPYIIIIDKYGIAKEQKIKKADDTELYKKAGFKKEHGFSKRHTWQVQLDENSSVVTNISVFGKTDGSAGRENKFDFPPPIDTILFFGTVVVVKYDVNNEHIVDLTEAEWKIVYNALLGGIEDLDEEDEDEEDEDEDDDEYDEDDEERILDPTKMTKQMYLKDDFVVDDDELEYESELSEEEYIV